MDFTFDGDLSADFHHEIRLMNTQSKEIFYKKLTFIYLEMPKFNQTDLENFSRFDKWMYVLKNLPRLEDRPKELQEKIFERFFKEASIARLTKEDMQKYDQSLKQYRDMYSVLKTAATEGREEGILEGIEKGIEKEKIEIAKKCLLKGMSPDDISELTGLTVEQIKEL